MVRYIFQIVSLKFHPKTDRNRINYVGKNVIPRLNFGRNLWKVLNYSIVSNVKREGGGDFIRHNTCPVNLNIMLCYVVQVFF